MKSVNIKSVSAGVLLTAAVIATALWIGVGRWGGTPPKQTAPPLRLPMMETVSWRSMETGPSGTVRLRGVRFVSCRGGLQGTIARIHWRRLESGGPSPAGFQLTGGGLHIEAGDTPVHRWLHRIGLDDAVADFEIRGVYEPARRRLHLDRLTASVRHRFRLEISAIIDRMDLQRALDQPCDTVYWLTALADMHIVEATVAYEDVDFARPLMARHPQAAEALRRRLGKRLVTAPADPPFGLSRTHIRSLIGFLDEPERCRIRIAPKPPVSMARLLLANDWERRIGPLRLETNESARPQTANGG